MIQYLFCTAWCMKVHRFWKVQKIENAQSKNLLVKLVSLTKVPRISASLKKEEQKRISQSGHVFCTSLVTFGVWESNMEYKDLEFSRRAQYSSCFGLIFYMVQTNCAKIQE